MAAPRPRLPVELGMSLAGWSSSGLVIGLLVAGLTVRANSSLRAPDDVTDVILALGVVYALLLLPGWAAGVALARAFGRIHPWRPPAPPARRPESARGRISSSPDASTIVLRAEDAPSARARAEQPAQPAQPAQEDGAKPAAEAEPPRESSALFSVHALAALATFGTFALTQAAVARLSGVPETDAASLATALLVALAVLALVLCVLTREPADRLLAQVRWALPIALTFTSGVFLLLALGSSEHVLRTPPLDAAAAGALRERTGPPRPPARIAPGSPRVMLIGVEGAGWAALQPLLERGDLPSLRGLVEAGVGTPMVPSGAGFSPVVWASIATGLPEELHGVRDRSELAVPGLERGLQRAVAHGEEPPLLPRFVGLVPLVAAIAPDVLDEVPVTSLQRRARALWSILAERGVACGVVRWPATWPAEELEEGYVVSDAAPRDCPGATWPPELLGALRPALEAAETGGEGSDVERALALPVFDGLLDARRAELAREPERLRAAREAVVQDRYAVGAALHLWTERGVGFLALHLGAPARLERLFDDPVVAAGAWKLLDRLLGRLVAAGGSDTTFVVVSGRGSPAPGDGGTREPGVLVLSGALVQQDGKPELAPTPFDITPTVLALFGLPASLRMPGAPLFGALRPQARERVPRVHPATYGPQPPPDAGTWAGLLRARREDAAE